jgi:hypothetical protein
MASWQALAEIPTPRAFSSTLSSSPQCPTTREKLNARVAETSDYSHAAIYSTSIMFMPVCGPRQRRADFQKHTQQKLVRQSHCDLDSAEAYRIASVYPTIHFTIHITSPLQRQYCTMQYIDCLAFLNEHSLRATGIHLTQRLSPSSSCCRPLFPGRSLKALPLDLVPHGIVDIFPHATEDGILATGCLS